MATETSGLKITVLDGQTAAGEREYFFDSSVRYVVVGRDPVACQVVLPEETLADGIGAEHIGFRRSLGRYQLDLNTDLYAEVDRRPPIEDMELGGTHEVRLGKKFRMRVEVVDTRAKPARVGKVMQSSDLSRRNQRFVAGTLVVIAGVAGLAVFNQMRLDAVKGDVSKSQQGLQGVTQNVQNLSQSLDFLNEQVDTIPNEVLAQVSRSVYMVIKADRLGGERAQGTAWVTEDGKLGTNAHVAEAFNKLKAGESLLVRSSVAPHATHRVKSVELHPGFKEFQKMWREYLPVQKQNGRLELMRTATPADVALMTVERPEELEPKLTLANIDDLEALRPGMRVAFAGYPSEMLLPGALRSPSPVIQQDEIIRLTNFFMINQEKDNRLIHHGLPITGGASGSPIITASGKVIGLISSGNFVFSRGFRTVNAADVNFGQRLDFLHSLLQNPPGSRQGLYDAEWRDQLSQFESAPNISIAAIRTAFASATGRPEPDDTTVLTSSITFVAPPTPSRTSYDVELPARGIYLFRMKSPMLGAGLTPMPDRSSPLSPLAMPLPFTTGLPYFLVVANDAARLKVDVRVDRAAYPELKRVDTEMVVERWPVDLSAGFLKLLERSRDFEWSSARRPVYLARRTVEDKFDFVNQHYVLPTELTIEKPGIYTFIAMPKKRGYLDGVLLQNGIATMGDRGSRPLVWFDMNITKPAQKVGFVTTSTSPVPQDVYVIYWEDVPDATGPTPSPSAGP